MRSAQKTKAAATRSPHNPPAPLAQTLHPHSAVPLHGATATTAPLLLTTKGSSAPSHRTMVLGQASGCKILCHFHPWNSSVLTFARLMH